MPLIYSILVVEPPDVVSQIMQTCIMVGRFYLTPRRHVALRLVYAYFAWVQKPLPPASPCSPFCDNLMNFLLLWKKNLLLSRRNIALLSFRGLFFFPPLCFFLFFSFLQRAVQLSLFVPKHKVSRRVASSVLAASDLIPASADLSRWRQTTRPRRQTLSHKAKHERSESKKKKGIIN